RTRSGSGSRAATRARDRTAGSETRARSRRARARGALPPEAPARSRRPRGRQSSSPPSTSRVRTAAPRLHRNSMARRGGWRRLGSRGRFRYVDGRGKPIADPEALERIEALRIPPAWRDVRISPRPYAKLQATGVDSAGRVQYLYHPDYRARQEQAKFDKLIRFAERLPDLRVAMAEHIDQEPLTFEWTAAVAVRLINLGWFRVGDERYAKKFRTFGITTLRKEHVHVRGSLITFRFRAKNCALVRTALIDEELADAMRELLAVKGGRRLFRYRN